MIEAYALYSGSSGNAYIIKSGKTVLLLDCGRSAAALRRAIQSVGLDEGDVTAILLTHEHSDHVSALRVFHKRHRIPIIGAAPVLSAVCDCEEMCSMARVPAGRSFRVGDITVKCCTVPHDSAANLSYGFVGDEGEYLVVATDIGEVTDDIRDHLRGATVAVIESNHDKNMLRCGPYPAYLKSRIASRFGHLSNDEAAELGLAVVREGCRGIVLAHLSRENNTPKLALDSFRRCLAAEGTTDVPLCCAGEDVPVRIVIDGDRCSICELREDLC